MARDISKLHPDLQVLLSKLQEECKKQGLIIGISECVRTISEQNALYAKGRTASGSIVTNAKGSTYSSMHQWGVAFDFYRNDGKGAYNDSDGFFSKVGKIGQNLGLLWGGECFGKSLIDKPHFQLSNWGVNTSNLKSLYKTPDVFMKCWKLQPSKSYITNKSCKDDVMWLQHKLGLVADGLYGPKTANAVLDYQKSKGWQLPKKATGYYTGSGTIKALSA